MKRAPLEGFMKSAFSSVERNSIVVCCALSLVLFFLPLLTFQVPISGEQQVSGYDLFSKVKQLRENLKSSDLPSVDKRSRSARVPSARDLPLSVQVSWLIPVAIAVAFLPAAVALIGAFLSAKAARAASAFSGARPGPGALGRSWLAGCRQLQAAADLGILKPLDAFQACARDRKSAV